MKISVFVAHIFLVLSCSAEVYDKVDVSAALQNRFPTFTDKPGLFTAILREVDEQGITELPWWLITINGTTLSHPQDRESLGKLCSRFTKDTHIRLYNTAEVGSVMANIINNVPHVEKVLDIYVFKDNLRVDFTDEHEGQRYVEIRGHYESSSSLTSTLNQFTEGLKYDGEVGEIKLYDITQRGLGQAAVLDEILWRAVDSASVILLDGTRPSVVFSDSLSNGDVTVQPWRKLYLDTDSVLALTPTDLSTIDRMRKNGVLSDDCVVRAGFYRTIIPWLPNKQEYDWSKLSS